MTNKFNKLPNTTYFGVPSGSLNKKTVELLIKAGIIDKDPGRQYEIQSLIENLVLRVLDRKEMPQNVADGVVDFGITGSDYIFEAGQENLPVVSDLVYSKTSNKPSRLVLASDPEIIQTIEETRGKRVATELPRLTQAKMVDLCDIKPEEYELIASQGKTEAKIKFGMADAYTDITETGSTLRANGFKELITLYYSNPQVIANPEAIQDIGIRELIEEVSLLLLAVLEAEKNPQTYLVMNVPKNKLETILKTLPANVSPTINPLNNPEWVALATLIPAQEAKKMSAKLLQAGARGIIEQNADTIFDESLLEKVNLAPLQ